MPTHAQQTFMPYRADQLFDLVADVGRYPEFLPWCIGARIREKSETRLVADLVIGFKVFRERFTSTVTLDRPSEIHVRYEEGPFRYLNNHWKFDQKPNGTTVNFYVDFEFRSRILQAAIGVVFTEAVRVMVAAFERRARRIYGPATALPQGPPAPHPTG